MSEQPGSAGGSQSGEAAHQPWSVRELVRYGWTWNDPDHAEEQPSRTGDDERRTGRDKALEVTSVAYPLPPAGI